MNKKRDIVIAICLIIMGIVFGIYFINNVYYGKIEHISNNIDMKLDNCRLVKEINTHGGFLGDGDYFAKLSCSNINYDELTNWKELPLTKTISDAVEIKQCFSVGCMDIYERFSIPSNINGYYYFIDRHSDSKDKYDDRELNDRSSWNFTLAMIDRETKVIYYYELDT